MAWEGAVGAMVFTKEQCEAAVERSLRTSMDPCPVHMYPSEFESVVSLSVWTFVWSVGQLLASKRQQEGTGV